LAKIHCADRVSVGDLLWLDFEIGIVDRIAAAAAALLKVTMHRHAFIPLE